MCDDVFDDGMSVLIEFAQPNAAPHTLGLYIDHNMGGVVKDAFVAGPLGEVCERFPDLRELDLAEARARVERALDVLDHTLDPSVDKDVDRLRGFMYARAKLLPGGAALPDEFEELAAEERESLLGDFLSSPEGEQWRNDADAEDVAAIAIEFGADYNYGGPLRWSPSVVEIFTTGWLARKVPREVEFFEHVPQVLRDWVVYAGRRRGVPAAAVDQAVGAANFFRQAMHDAVSDPERRGPAKAFAIAAQEAGVDPTDADALNEFASATTRNWRRRIAKSTPPAAAARLLAPLGSGWSELRLERVALGMLDRVDG
jgi:hypothetical protein